jgi:hypothetical protein
MSIKQRASRSWAKTSRKAALPTWTNLAGAAALATVVVVLLAKIFLIHGPAPIATIANTVPYPTATTSSTTVSTGASVSIPSTSGSTQSVPAAALTVANAAAVALYTGNFAGVPLAPNAKYHAPSIRYHNPQVTSPTVAGPGTNTLTFYFDVAPTPSSATISVTINVENTAGKWAWAGEAG